MTIPPSTGCMVITPSFVSIMWSSPVAAIGVETETSVSSSLPVLVIVRKPPAASAFGGVARVHRSVSSSVPTLTECASAGVATMTSAAAAARSVRMVMGMCPS